MSNLKSFPFRILSCFFLFLLFGCTNNGSQSIERICPPINGLDALSKPGQVLLIGEIHGTKEGPGFIDHIVCHLLEQQLAVSVGLELPQADQAVVDGYLASDGREPDLAKVLSLSFWAREYQDGRASQAMFDLLESVRQLKQAGKDVELMLIDQPAADDRDVAMANKIIEAAEKQVSRVMVVLTGNYHNMIYPGSGQMGTYVLDRLGAKRVLSLLQSYTGGSAWVDVAGEGFGPIGLRGDGRKEVGVFLDKGLGEYHGTLEVDSIHYSRPAKEMLEH